MVSRYAKFLCPALAMFLLFAGCANTTSKNPVADNTYIYEKEGFGSDFTIAIQSDGIFTYSEGALSSHIGMGEWELDGNTLILRDNTIEGHPYIYYFTVDGDDLIFMAENSSDFMYLDVLDQERFTTD